MRTSAYLTSEEEAELHSILLRWMLEQIPLIKHELNPPAAAKDAAGETTQKRRKRAAAANLAKEHVTKRPRRQPKEKTLELTVSTPIPAVKRISKPSKASRARRKSASGVTKRQSSSRHNSAQGCRQRKHIALQRHGRGSAGIKLESEASSTNGKRWIHCTRLRTEMSTPRSLKKSLQPSIR